jgi:O-acetyl-ADP-ribose deacetylase (regulator of RNase III)
VKVRIGNSVLELIQGDITEEFLDAIVNAANRTLLGGGGVDGAIHAAGGPRILEECRKLGGCTPGDAKITIGGLLPASYVIHTVGPVYRDGKHREPELLASCYRRSLEVASEYNLKSIAFPAISTGIYGYPCEDAAAIALQAVKDYLESHTGIKLVRFVLYDRRSYDGFADALRKLAPNAIEEDSEDN